jgi:hypothetical protein
MRWGENKSEARRAKSEKNSKFESAVADGHVSEFGFLSDFGNRISDFQSNFAAW